MYTINIRQINSKLYIASIDRYHTYRSVEEYGDNPNDAVLRLLITIGCEDNPEKFRYHFVYPPIKIEMG